MSEECGTCAHHGWEGTKNYCKLHRQIIAKWGKKCGEFRDMYKKDWPPAKETKS